jgi:hypothetical protein
MNDYSDERYDDVSAFGLDWRNPPKLEDLKYDYNSAKSYHSNVLNKITDWRTILLAPDRDFGKNRSKITPKTVKKQAEWTYPILEEPMLSSGNMFSFDAVTAEDPESARDNSIILNHQMNKEMDKTAIITAATRRFVDDGTLIIKIGWDKRETYKKEFIPKFKWVGIQDPEKAQALIEQGLPPYERVSAGYEQKLKTKVIKNAPYLEVMDPALVVIDPNANGDLNKAQFVIEEFDTCLSDLRKSNIYKNLNIVESKMSQSSQSNENTSDELADDNASFSFKDKSRMVFRAIRYWGYWDIDGNGMTSPFVATWIGDTLIHIERNPLPYIGLPFEMAQFKPVHKSNYGEPDAEIIKDNQEIIGAITRGWLDMMGRSAAGQTGIQKGFMSPIERIKYENREDYEFNPGHDPKTAIHVNDFPELNASALNMIQMQQNDVESLTGRKAFNSGISGNALGESATGIRSALDASSKREMGILRRFASAFERAAIKMVTMNNVFLSDEEIFRITNSDYLINNRDKDYAKYDLKIKIETPEQKEAKVQNISFMMQTMGNTLPFELTQIQLADLYELKNMPELAKKVREYKPQPDPKQELEMQLLQAQLGQIQASTQEDMADVQLKGAKAEETIAKAKLLGSQKNLHDLDYMDKESHRSKIYDTKEKMMIEKMKINKDLEKEKMKQDIVAAQLMHDKNNN